MNQDEHPDQYNHYVANFINEVATLPIANNASLRLARQYALSFLHIQHKQVCVQCGGSGHGEKECPNRKKFYRSVGSTIVQRQIYNQAFERHKEKYKTLRLGIATHRAGLL